MGQPNGPKVSFTRMADGTPEDYELLARFEDDFAAGTADRVLTHLRGTARFAGREPEVLTAEIVEDLHAALQAFQAVAGELEP